MDEAPYRTRLLDAYVQALADMRLMIAAPDFTAAQARKVVYLEQQLARAGYRPVYEGSWWRLEPLEKKQ